MECVPSVKVEDRQVLDTVDHVGLSQNFMRVGPDDVNLSAGGWGVIPDEAYNRRIFLNQYVVIFRVPHDVIPDAKLSVFLSSGVGRGEFRPRQTRQLPRAVDLKGGF